ncbi:MAG: polysaccharide deacetylase family protein [Syntrophobacteraceae bacterium]
MRKLLRLSATTLAASLFLFSLCLGEVITRLPTNEKVVSLTFDACETRTPSNLDRSILNYLLGEHIPFTIFVSGKFAARNSLGCRYGFRSELKAYPISSF